MPSAIGMGIGIPFKTSWGGWSPTAWFAASEQGAWYDSGDFSALNQVSTGTTPVTAVEQLIGRVLDKSGRGNTLTQATAGQRPTLRNKYNVLTYTEQMDNAAWTKSAVTVTANAAAAPDGTMTADLLTPTGNACCYLGGINSPGQSPAYAMQIWLQSATGSSFTMPIGVNGSGVNPNPQKSTITVTTAWQLFTIAITGAATSNSFNFNIGDFSAAWTTGENLNAWGASFVYSTDSAFPYQTVAASTSYANPASRYPVGFSFALSSNTSLTAAAGGGGTTGGTWVLRFRNLAPGVAQTIWSDAGTNTGYRIRINTSNQIEFSAGNGVSYTAATVTAPVMVGDDVVITAWHDGATLSVQVDDGTVATAAMGAVTAGTAGFTLGKDNGAASGYLTGRIYNLVYVRNVARAAVELTLAKAFVAAPPVPGPFNVPTLSGLAAIGEVLTASASALIDADNLGSFSYQWLRDGAAISAATATTYTLQAADSGTATSCKVSWTDGMGAAKSVASFPVQILSASQLGSWVTLQVAKGDALMLWEIKSWDTTRWRGRAIAAMSDCFQLGTDTTAIQVTRPVGVANQGGTSWARVASEQTFSDVFDIYVDSVGGNDSNAGTLAAPKQTLAGIGTITDNLRIGLKRGSTWREKIAPGSVSGVAIRAYGSGAAPILDGSAVISAGSWAKTGGYVNIYEVSLAVETSSAPAEWPQLWLNGVSVPYVSSLATLDATPNAIYYGVVTDTTPITLYVHSTGSTDPRIDGKTYEAAMLDGVVNLLSATYSEAKNLVTKRPYTSYGSVTAGRYCHIRDCSADQGNTHNAFQSAYSILERVTATDSYSAGSASTMFIAYEGTVPASAWARTLSCTATDTAITANNLGFYQHSGSGTFDYKDDIGAAVANCSTGYSVDNTSDYYLRASSTSNTNLIVSPVNANLWAHALYIRNVTASGYMGNFTGAKTYQFENTDAIWGTSGYIRALTAGSTIKLLNSVRYEGANSVLLQPSVLAPLTIICTGNNFVPAGRMFDVYQFTSNSPTVTSDNNAFGGATGPFTYGGVANTLAQWKALGYDTNSTA